MMRGSREHRHLLTSVVLCSLAVCLVYGQYTNSICQTMQYRSLSVQLQNEHQCMILEKLQTDFDKEKNALRKQYHNLAEMISKFETSMVRHMQSMNTPSKNTAKAIPVLRDIPLVRDCNELYTNGVTLSGVYPMRLPNRNILNVWCDMDTDYGGWMLVQRRMDGSVNFARGWDDYAFGFGNVNSEYWLGNDNMYWISSLKNYTLRVDLWDWEDNHVYAVYDTFLVESEKNQFRLRLGKYSGTAGDAMTPYHNNMRFSTTDADNDEWNMNCARKDQSGWWFRACGFASLNGIYISDGVVNMAPDGLIKGIIWYQWKNDYGYSMKRTEMKIKPLTQVKADRQKALAEARKTTKANNDSKKTATTTEATTQVDSETLRSESTTASIRTETSAGTTKDPDYSDDDDYSESIDG